MITETEIPRLDLFCCSLQSEIHQLDQEKLRNNMIANVSSIQSHIQIVFILSIWGKI
jgi:hypothetical protein